MFPDDVSMWNPWSVPQFPPVQGLDLPPVIPGGMAPGGGPMPSRSAQELSPPVPQPVVDAQPTQNPIPGYHRSSQDVGANQGGMAYGTDLAPPFSGLPPPAQGLGTRKAAEAGAVQPGQKPGLADILRGVQAPKPPEVQKVSTPHAPQTRAIPQQTALLELMQLIGRPMSGQPQVPYSLGAALRG